MPHSSSPAHRWRILGVMCLAVFMVVVDNTIVNVALPSISRDLSATNADLQWIVDGYSLPFAGLLLAGGGLSDRWGRKRLMMFGLLAFGGFSVLAAFSSSIPTLLVARALMGASAAFVFPSTLSILTVSFPDPSERAKAFGVWGATSGLAVAFGPLVGGALITHFWYGSIFLVNAPIVALTLLAAWRIVPESKNPLRRPMDPVGLVLGTSSILTLVLAIIEGPSWGWTSATILGLFGAAAVLLVAFCRFELRRPAPLLDVRVFTVPRFSAAAGAIAFNFFGLFGFIFLVTQYFQLIRGYSALSSGVHTLPFAITSMVVTPLGAVLALRLGARWVVSGGLLIMAVALAWFGTLPADAAYFGPIIVSMVVLATGFSLVTAPSTAATMSALGPTQLGAGAAVNNTTRELGGTLGVALLGSVFASKFAPAISSTFRHVALTSAARAAATGSTQGALAVVAHAPAALRGTLDAGVVSAFLSGMHRSCVVAAVIVAVVALPTWAFLPSRAESVDVDEASALAAVPVAQ